MPPELLDPGRRHPGPSRTTYPPTLLMLYVPMAGLPYRVQRIAWFLLEWAALVAALVLLAGAVRPRVAKVAFLAVGLIFFVGGELALPRRARAVLRLHPAPPRDRRPRPPPDGPGCLACRPLVRTRSGLATHVRAHGDSPGPARLSEIGRGHAGGPRDGHRADPTLVRRPGLDELHGNRPGREQVAASGDEAGAFLEHLYGPSRPVPAVAEGMNLTDALPIETGGSTLLANFRPIHADLPAWSRRRRFQRSRGPYPHLRRRRLGPLPRNSSAASERLGAVRRRICDLVLDRLGILPPDPLQLRRCRFLGPLALLTPALIRVGTLMFARTCVLTGLVVGQYRTYWGGKMEFLRFSLLAIGLSVEVQLGWGRRRGPDQPPSGTPGPST